jgi:hypothetical protein
MAAPTKRRFYNPNDVLHGLVSVNTVQSIGYSKNFTRLAGQGDNDVTDSFQAKTNMQVAGDLVIQDPVQADALIDASEAQLSWKGVPETGGAIKTITITGVSFFTLSERDAHAALDNITLGWNAYNPSGTDPVTVATAP